MLLTDNVGDKRAKKVSKILNINFSFDLYTATTTYTIYDILDTAICMIWDFVDRRPLPARDYMVSIKGGPKL